MTAAATPVLLPEDVDYLQRRGLQYQVCEESGLICVVLHGWSLPLGFDHKHVDVLIRLSVGYPDVAPDMWWVDPPLRRTDGVEIPATQQMEAYLGRQWQRWSRHLSGGQWLSGVDRLEAYVAQIAREFGKAGGSGA